MVLSELFGVFLGLDEQIDQLLERILAVACVNAVFGAFFNIFVHNGRRQTIFFLTNSFQQFSFSMGGDFAKRIGVCSCIAAVLLHDCSAKETAVMIRDEGSIRKPDPSRGRRIVFLARNGIHYFLRFFTLSLYTSKGPAFWFDHGNTDNNVAVSRCRKAVERYGGSASRAAMTHHIRCTHSRGRERHCWRSARIRWTSASGGAVQTRGVDMQTRVRIARRTVRDAHSLVSLGR